MLDRMQDPDILEGERRNAHRLIKTNARCRSLASLRTIAITNADELMALDVSEGARDPPLVVLVFGRHRIPRSFGEALLQSPLATSSSSTVGG